MAMHENRARDRPPGNQDPDDDLTTGPGVARSEAVAENPAGWEQCAQQDGSLQLSTLSLAEKTVADLPQPAVAGSTRRGDAAALTASPVDAAFGRAADGRDPRPAPILGIFGDY